MMTFDQIHNNQQALLLQCISGSKAYGLDTPQSDTDIRGVFALDKKTFYGLRSVEQVDNPSNDITYYELKRFVELLLRNNPNILELLNTPPDKVLYRHPVMDLIRPEMFLSKLCLSTFAGYAQSQIKKAKGLNKKIFNPIDEKRKSVLDFCHIIEGYSTVPLQVWLQQNAYAQADCGLINIPHSRDMYAVFHQSQTPEKLWGICSGDDANDIVLSSIPEKLEPKALMSFNKEGYSIYCREYAEYWDWVEKRNETRYQNTLQHGKNYDAKNMMHTFRLLNMAEEIALEKQVNVFRPDRDFLLSIRTGEFLYDDLVKKATKKIEKIKKLYARCDLPEQPNEAEVNAVLVKMREQLLTA
ncbi:DNA polymerase beta superfamily protein [Candidatus Symbiothrix dinenymphae]|uniref:nucleotidyltransferase domain-containing protein n=1 Tax=Candidatus Symbiothrix dinenymphae TaxID=467085 RepID=UPI001D052F3E|nr:nucleotidyltransferase domain-containing protein [Candidatus Symbiothrix dinenymphae]